MEFAYRAS